MLLLGNNLAHEFFFCALRNGIWAQLPDHKEGSLSDVSPDGERTPIPPEEAFPGKAIGGQLESTFVQNAHWELCTRHAIGVHDDLGLLNDVGMLNGDVYGFTLVFADVEKLHWHVRVLHDTQALLFFSLKDPQQEILSSG